MIQASAATVISRQRIDAAIGGVLAAVAALWHASLLTRATNDNFLHLTFAQQWLHGDWPVRDFFDQGWVLQYALSAATQLLLGERLAAESVIVGLAWGISCFLVYSLVHRLTGSRLVAVASAALLIVSSARGYSYPKGIVYAVAAVMWWRYVDSPATRRLVVFGTWTAVAFYWRPDHGVYVAIGLTLAVLAAHGVSRTALARCLTAAAVTIAWILPFLVYVQLVYGLVPYVQTGLTQAEVEHGIHGTHEWPLLRYASSLIEVEPADRYAPIVAIRWNRDSSEDTRHAIRTRYALTTVSTERDGVERVRLSAASIPQVRALIGEPSVDDTGGIDRSTGTLTEREWPARQRRRFSYAIMRVQVLPMLDARARASEFAGALFFIFPIALLIAAPWVARRLQGTTAGASAAFAVFAIVVAWAMIRNPLTARVADAVVLSAIGFGCCVGALWRSGRSRWVRAVARSGVLVIAVAVVLVSAVAGQFETASSWFTDARATYRELSASPPLAFYIDRPARFTLRLAAYVRDCLPPDERVLVLWFEPEIYYFSDRLMAQRHAVFAPAWAALEHEQQATLDKIRKFAPPIVLARQSALDEYTSATYPTVVDYVRREYTLASTAADGGERYLIYVRSDRTPSRSFGLSAWPCFTPRASLWERAGLARGRE